MGSKRWRSEQRQRCRPEPVRIRYLYVVDGRVGYVRSTGTGLVAQEQQDWLHEAVFEQQGSKKCKIGIVTRHITFCSSRTCSLYCISSAAAQRSASRFSVPIIPPGECESCNSKLCIIKKPPFSNLLKYRRNKRTENAKKVEERIFHKERRASAA